MSRTYRLLVTCDEQGSTECQGVLDLRAGYPWEVERLENEVHQQGWRQGVPTADLLASFDVCPACWPAVERRLHEWGRPVPPRTVDDAPIVLDAVQLRALGAEAAEPE